MSNRERNFQGRVQTLAAFALLLFIAMISTGCGGGASPSSAGSTTATPPSGTTTAASLKADAGAVCETLLSGATYSKTPPSLSCNHGTNAYTAFLDGSKSTAPSGQTLSYAWTFVSKPAGSTATLAGANTVRPTFTPDKAGSYTVQLVVSAGGVASSRAVALVVALDDAMLNPDLVANPGATSYKFHGGLPNNCSACHNESYPTLPHKTSTHIATSNACQSCHFPESFAVINFVDHAEVFGTCSSCHDGVTAIGKSPVHVATTQECSDCHNTTSFIDLNPDGTFDHSKITTEPCSGCHNGVTAKGTASDPNPSGHPNISVECNSCHTTVTFATPFPNHSDPRVVVPGTCGTAGCHDGVSMANGVQITGENSAPHPHINTGPSIACDLCHNTTSYNMGGVFTHSVLGQLPAEGITVSCSTCHDGLNAMGVPAPTATFTHTTRTDCASCHNTAAFKPAFNQDHTGFDATTNCTGGGCHNGTDATGMPTDSVHNSTTNPNFSSTIVTSGLCGTCHTPPGGSFHTATVDHSAGVFGTLGSTTPAIDCTSCHDGNITTAQAKPSNHIVTTANCRDCHSPQAPSFAGGVVDHSTIVTINNSTVPPSSTPTCASCHDGSTATGQSGSHVPMTAASGTDCLVCHGTVYTNFIISTFDHAAAGITSNCSSCHDGNTHDTTRVITKPAGHIPTSADCSSCHTSTYNGPGINGTSASGYATAARFTSTVHPAYTTGCRSCHNGSYDNAVYNARKHPTDSVHTTVDANNWDCNACHTTTGNFLETNPVNHQDPAIQAQQCISCHANGNTTEPIGKSSSHPTTSDQCQGCHQAGGSFTAGFDHTALDTVGGPDYHRACTTCHDGTTATGKPQNHVATTSDCVSCHAGHPPTVMNFANGTFSHSGPEMTGKLCMDCHDGTILGALGKSAKPDHVVTTSDCAACHTTTAFKPATAVDHTGKTSGCADSGCHAAGTADVVDVTDDPNRTHIPIVNAGTEVDCYNCHKNPGGTFAGATMSHTVVTFESCQTCHGGNYDGANSAHLVTAKSSTHFVTSVAACASCHKSTTAWTPVGVLDYTHTSGGGYPGNHNTGKVGTCVKCHKDTQANANISTFPLSPYNSTCAACHYSTGQREHGNPLPSSKYNCGNSGCHRVSSSSF